MVFRGRLQPDIATQVAADVHEGRRESAHAEGSLEMFLQSHLMRQEMLLNEHFARIEKLISGQVYRENTRENTHSVDLGVSSLTSLPKATTKIRSLCSLDDFNRPIVVDEDEETNNKPRMVARESSYKKKYNQTKWLTRIQTTLGRSAASQATVWLDWWLDLEEPPITSKWGRFVTSRWFELGCALVIAVNTMVMVYRTDHEAESLTEDRHSELRVLNAVFVILYSMELAAKLSVHRLYFFCNIDMAWNLFDGGLVLLSIIDLIMAEVTVSETLDVNHMRTMRLAMRVLRTTKVLRMFRLIRYFSELRLILNSVVGSFVSLFWSILMLVFMFFIFGLVFVQGATNAQISDTEGVLLPAERDLIRTNLGSTRAAILVLFKSTTGGENWTIFYDMMTLVGHWHAFLFLFFIAFAQFALLNILTGLFVENAMKLAQPDRDTAALQQRKQDMSEADELRSLCMSLDTNRTGYISEELFMQQLNDEQFKARLALLGLDIKHTALFFDVVCSDFKHKQVEIEAFVSAAMRLKGLATSLDLQTLTFGTKLIHENQLKMYSSLEERLAVILECLDKGQLREAGKGTPSFKGGAHVTTMCTMTETEVDASFSL